MIRSVLSLGSKNFWKKNKNEATRAKIHALVLGQNFPKPAIVRRRQQQAGVTTSSGVVCTSRSTTLVLSNGRHLSRLATFVSVTDASTTQHLVFKLEGLKVVVVPGNHLSMNSIMR